MNIIYVTGYLILPHPEGYTSYCFKLSYATFLTDSGADITSIKTHRGWKSTSVAKTYIELC